MAYGPGSGLDLIDHLGLHRELDGYHLFHAARADLLRRAGKLADAGHAYRRALDLVGNETEREYLEDRLAEVSSVA